MSDSGPVLLLPIETKNREFHAKLLLACHAASRGFRVLLGEQNEMRHLSPYLPRGIVLDKSIARTKTRLFRKYLDLGFRVGAWCEEGLVFRDSKAYLKERISTESFELVDVFFAWGSRQFETLTAKLTDTEKIVLSGNPRFDLLRPPYRDVFRREADAIRERYGQFVLINTNFSRFNHFNGRDFAVETLKRQGRIRNREDEEFFVHWSDYLGDMFRHFLCVVPQLSVAFPNHAFIVRPHPSENHEVWKRETWNLPNVHVVHEGNVIPWIMGSMAVVHNSCTTGVEGYLLDKDVIAYCPIKSDLLDSWLPNGVSHQAETPEHLIKLLTAILKDPTSAMGNLSADTDARRLARYFIANVDGPPSSRRVVDALVELAERKGLHGTHVPQFATSKCYLFGFARPLGLRVRRLGRGDSDAYQKQKFPGLSLSEVQTTLNVFRRVEPTFGAVQVARVHGPKQCFWIAKR